LRLRYTYLSALLIFLLSWFNSSAQSYNINGQVADTINFQSTANVSIQLTDLNDSAIHQSTLTNDEGYFTLKAAAGRYLLVLSHPLFDSYKDTFTVTNKAINAGLISMPAKKHLLDEVFIRNRPSMMMKGDTLEFTADSFKVRDYANTDELLLKLPGISVDRQGRVTAQGEAITKILVDGEEFFSTDPMEVARILRAAAIDKIQVFNQKSEQATFTGINDGIRNRTINLVLKEDAKQGYFGNIKTGGGLPDFYDGQGIINAFKSKRKVSAFAGASNITQSTNYSNGPVTNAFGQPGLPQNRTAAIHYDNKWLNNDLTIAGNYQYRDVSIENTAEETTQYNMPDSQYRSNKHINTGTHTRNHAATLNGRYVIDTSAYIRFNFNYTKSTGSNNIEQNAGTYSADGLSINTQNQTRAITNNTDNAGLDFFYGKRFKKTGRTLSLDIKSGLQRNSNEWFIRTASRFNALPPDSLRERKESSQDNQHIEAKLSYTDALTRDISLELGYGLNYNQNNSEQLSFDLLGNPDNHGVLDTAFSTRYDYGILMHSGGAKLKFNRKEWSIVAGSDLNHTTYRQRDFLGTRNYNYAVINIAPVAGLSYTSRQININLNYNGQTQQPTIEQLQPLVQNIDPLNIYIGNPALRQEFRHQINFYGNLYTTAHNTNIFVNIMFSGVQNAISQSQYTDNQGRRTNQYINVNGNMQHQLIAGYGRDIEALKLKVNLQLEVAGNKSVTEVNGENNKATQKNYTAGLTLMYSGDQLFNLNTTSNLSFSESNNSVQEDIPDRFILYEQTSGLDFTPWQRLRLNTAAKWMLRNKADATDTRNSILSWNAFISYAFLQNRSLMLSLSVNDILNQNTGFTRSVRDNTITYSTYVSVRRYTLLSLNWNFNHSSRRKSPAE
jgi:hypothetical protein